MALAECCGIENPILRASCFDTAVLGIELCLANLPRDAEKPENCWGTYLNLLTVGCGKNAPCALDDGVQACANGAQKVFAWCAAVEEEKLRDEAAQRRIDARTARWEQRPERCRIGDRYDLGVVTEHESVGGVTFWLVRPDAQPDAEDRVARLGSAEMIGSLRQQRVWHFTARTDAWPVADDETRVLLVARSENDEGEPIAVSQVLVKIDR